MAFTIYPAIDIRGGQCVRLVQGDYDQETVYGEDPVSVARQWEEQGADWIHVVDLDGAKAGEPTNAELIIRIAGAVKSPIQVGGGIRNLADVSRYLEAGVARVILGTAALEDPAFVRDALSQFGGERIAIGIDARDGYVATRGWLDTSEVKAEELAVTLAEAGARTFIFTDIARDGMLQGPNVESIVRLAKVSGQSVIASGGVSQVGDLEQLHKYVGDGVSGAIVGKALYTDRIALPDAIAATKGER
jgi:phosphoribosylformimino-5-aminoimidazole carboxamide ribotide isomerase